MSLYFEKINNIDNTLAKLTERKRRPKSIKLEIKEGVIATHTTKIQRS
jgi:hypothetical protein